MQPPPTAASPPSAPDADAANSARLSAAASSSCGGGYTGVGPTLLDGNNPGCQASPNSAVSRGGVGTMRNSGSRRATAPAWPLRLRRPCPATLRLHPSALLGPARLRPCPHGPASRGCPCRPTALGLSPRRPHSAVCSSPAGEIPTRLLPGMDLTFGHWICHLWIPIVHRNLQKLNARLDE